MTAPRLKSFSDLLEGYTTAVQGSAAAFIDFSRGSVLRAAGEAISQVALWLQGLILTLLSATRLSTSSGTDVDTWLADFGISRLPATSASGNATFSRRSGSGSATVPVGATIQSFDGTQSFVVTRNSNLVYYSTTQDGYVMTAGALSVIAPVTAQTPGADGNAASGTVTVITSPMTGVDLVNNATAFTGGTDVESDDATRTRFQLYIAGLSRATPTAVAGAVNSIPGVTTYSITENQNPDGTDHLGYFYVVVDDGTGMPSGNLLSAVSTAVDLVRPIGTTFDVNAPQNQMVTITFKVAAAPGYLLSQARNRAQAAVLAYVNALPVGAGLNVSRIAQVAYEASPGVANVFNVMLNGGATDIAASPQAVIRTNSVTVSS